MSLHRVFQQAMWVYLSLGVLFCFMIFPPVSFALFENKIENFSADQVLVSPDGQVDSSAKIYITPNACRMDGMPGIAGQSMPSAKLTFLWLKKQKRQYVYNHDKKVYFESEMEEGAMMKELSLYKNAETERILGKETVSGYPCVKKEVTVTHAVMGRKITNKSIVWVNDRFDFPLRTRFDQGHMVELRHIDTDKPSGKLFRRRPGYKKVNHMMAAMGFDFAAGDQKKAASDDQIPEKAQRRIQDVDPEEILAGMRQAMGKDADPAQMAQMEQALTHALDRARQIHTDQGASGGLWQVIPRRPGDDIGNEIKGPHFFNATMGTRASFKSVCRFYENKLTAKGWQIGGKHIQNNTGFMMLKKGTQQLMMSSADNPGMAGTYKNFYNIKLSGPDL